MSFLLAALRSKKAVLHQVGSLYSALILCYVYIYVVEQILNIISTQTKNVSFMNNVRDAIFFHNLLS
jgi:flagellar biogenesis protein FliO